MRNNRSTKIYICVRPTTTPRHTQRPRLQGTKDEGWGASVTVWVLVRPSAVWDVNLAWLWEREKEKKNEKKAVKCSVTPCSPGPNQQQALNGQRRRVGGLQLYNFALQYKRWQLDFKQFPMCCVDPTRQSHLEQMVKWTWTWIAFASLG